MSRPIRDEPGRTLLRQYMLPRLKNQRGNPLARVDTEAGFLVGMGCQYLLCFAHIRIDTLGCVSDRRPTQ